MNSTKEYESRSRVKAFALLSFNVFMECFAVTLVGGPPYKHIKRNSIKRCSSNNSKKRHQSHSIDNT